MKTTELRLGNYVKTKRTGFGICVVNSISYFSIGLSSFYGEPFKIEEIESIPINENILLSMGFENSTDEMFIYTDRETFYWRKFEGHLEVMGEKYFIKNIHELQNLYFTITGKELTVNPKNIYYKNIY